MPNIIEQYIEHNHFGKSIGMNFTIIEPGLIHYVLKITPNHLATPLAAHGGVISALMDGLIGVTGLSAVAHENNIISTIEFKLNFMSPALLHDELLGIGKIEQQGKRLMVVSGEISCPQRNNVVIAKGLGTLNIYPAEKAGFVIK
jgi:uncharacterized protein (TIGR00369 family)